MIKKALKIIILLTTVALLTIAGIVIYLALRFAPHKIDIKAADRPADQRILLVGNSLTDYNNLSTLVDHLAEAGNPAWDDVLVVSDAPGGYTFAQHLQDMQNTAENPAIRQLLVTGSATLRAWNLIVFQEQSELPGFNNEWAAKQVSLNSAQSLVNQARASGAAIMLLLTWGYVDGDKSNPTIYPDYLSMQTRLTQGYDNMAGLLAANGSPVFVAPAGLGFQLVYEDIANTGADPLAKNSLFRQLYADDHHPSLAGSYLAACILLDSYTGRPISPVNWKPKGLKSDVAAYLRGVADRVVFGDRFPGRSYPFR